MGIANNFTTTCCFAANTGLRPDEAWRLQFRDVTIVEDEASGKTILEIEVRGKRGVGYCKSMSGAVRPFERLESQITSGTRIRRGQGREEGRTPSATAPKNGARPQPTDLIFPKWQRELFKTILDEENLRFDREGRPRTAYSLRHTYICSAPDGRCGHLPDRQELPHQRRDDREILRGAHQDASLDAAAINIMRPKKNKKGKKAIRTLRIHRNLQTRKLTCKIGQLPYHE